MTEHIIYLIYYFLFLISTIGHGLIFSRFVFKDFIGLNLGYQGLIGFFSVSLISIFSSFLTPHDYVHNSILHCLGLIGFFSLLKNRIDKFKEIKILCILSLIFLIGAYLYKNHDDFPYYHLTYSLNLSQNKFIIGTGIFSHGFRTFSSLFYYHSTLLMPGIEIYLFHIGPLYILVFFNFVIIKKLFFENIKKQYNFTDYFSLIGLIFINVAFYRISEHGTDRSAQVLLILIFLIFFEIFYFELNKKKLDRFIYLLIILIFLASFMKVIYYLYIILIPAIFFKKKYFFSLFKKKNLILFFVLSFGFLANITTNYLNTGCFVYPAVKTCIIKSEWSLPAKEVQRMSTHYEWWSKAGGGPSFRSQLEPETYIKDFNWINGWIERHFFNKVSDTLFGILFICLLVFLRFYFKSDKKFYKPKFKYGYIYFFPILFLLEWFFNHPAMRYGGYVLIGLPFFILTSIKLCELRVKKNDIYKNFVVFVSIALVLFVTRNIVRLEKEMSFYNYNIIKSPFFYLKDVDYHEILNKDDFKVFSPNNDMCWASKTPCSYRKKMKTKKFFGFDMVYKND